MAMTAICFLADERVWDYENYPDWNPELPVGTCIEPETAFENYKKLMGGDKNMFLRELLKGKHLA
jgi:hypothetical protein